MAAHLLGINGLDQRLGRYLEIATELLLLASLGGYFVLPAGQSNHFLTYLLAIVVLFSLGYGDLSRLRLVRSRVFLASTMFVVYLACTALWSEDVSLLGIGKAFGKALLVLAMILGIVMVGRNDRAAVQRLMFVVVGAAVLSASYYLIHVMLGTDAEPPGRLATRSVGGMAYGAAAVVAIASLVSSTSSGVRFALCGAIGVLFAALWFCDVDYVWVAVSFAVAATLMMQLWERRATTMVWILVPALVVTLTLVSASLAEVMTSERQLIWRPVVDTIFKLRPIVGLGILEQPTPAVDCSHSDWIMTHFSACVFAHPHNAYLSTFYFGGVIGLFLLFVLILMTYGSILEKRDTNISGVALAGITYGCTVFFFDGNRLVDKIDFIWILYWLPVGLAALLEVRKSRYE